MGSSYTERSTNRSTDQPDRALSADGRHLPNIRSLRAVSGRERSRTRTLVLIVVALLIIAVIGLLGVWAWTGRNDLSGVLPIFAALAAGTLIGGGIVFWRMRARVRAVQASGESLRGRLLSVERNQALWVSLSAVLHDVRNPLHNLNLLMECLGAPGVDATKLRAQVAHELDRINVRMRRVATQASEFLEIDLRPTPLYDVLNEVDGMIRPLAKQSSVSFSFHCATSLKVLADHKFLVQAVDHLLLNSLQILMEQAPEKPRRLSVTAMSEGDRVSLAIDDSGPGLPETVRAHPFEPLMASRSNGMGLGLTIAHALARAAGADLSIARTGDSGTQFHLTLKTA